MSTFHKKGKIICLECNKNEVSRWNISCKECRSKRKKNIEHSNDGVAKRKPAAILTNDNGQKVYVDKHGRKMDNPGYDLDNDPRGYKTTGTVKRTQPEIIT